MAGSFFQAVRQKFAPSPVRAPLPALDRPLVVVDVGCRWGLADRWLDEGATLYGFDPDADECARLRAKYASRPVRTPGSCSGRTPTTCGARSPQAGGRTGTRPLPV